MAGCRAAKGIVAIVLTGTLLTPACSKSRRLKQPLSVLEMSDPRSTGQLLYGFYGLESNLWRWSGRSFGVFLQPPKGSDRTGARLTVKLFFPDSEILQLGSITMRVETDRCVLKREIFQRAGPHDYEVEIGPELCLTNSLPLQFTLDKATPPSLADGRELGAVVSYIGLASK